MGNGGEEGAKKGVAPDLLRISYGFASEKSVESSVEIISNFNLIYELTASWPPRDSLLGASYPQGRTAGGGSGVGGMKTDERTEGGGMPAGRAFFLGMGGGIGKISLFLP